VYDLSTSYFEKRMFHVVLSANFAKPDVVT